mmetsp:Transcript_34234/g.63484  ORF Transcript_34234/g.63484 Transcript_34234/m.63484 type:complete len:92 (-) Transcript_34234:89-364(-)
MQCVAGRQRRCIIAAPVTNERLHSTSPAISFHSTGIDVSHVLSMMYFSQLLSLTFCVCVWCVCVCVVNDARFPLPPTLEIGDFGVRDVNGE